MKKTTAILMIIVILAVLLSSCGAKSADYAVKEEYGDYPASTSAEQKSSFYPTDEVAGYDSAESEGVGLLPTESIGLKPGGGLKIIYTSSLYMQTEKFKESYDALVDLINKNEGYIQYSDISGGYTSDSGYYYEYYAYFTVRIPADKYSSFLTHSESIATITNKSENSEDITSVYIDTEARLNSLKVQEERLLDLLKTADIMADIIEIESKLSDVRYQIESYQSQKNTYDNLLGYSTVNIELREVKQIVSPKNTFGERVTTAIKESFELVMDFFRGFVIFLIYALPFIVIILIVFFIVRAIVKRAKKKRKERQINNPVNQQMPPPPYMPNPYLNDRTDNNNPK
ncbi:MAG: DUF4349 domain-containing protein [Ruminococcaceae bacterium]|nr:DUF4349 domain-containing protein [Oscillospiraceae bacterium]